MLQLPSLQNFVTTQNGCSQTFSRLPYSMLNEKSVPEVLCVICPDKDQSEGLV